MSAPTTEHDDAKLDALLWRYASGDPMVPVSIAVNLALEYAEHIAAREREQPEPSARDLLHVLIGFAVERDADISMRVSTDGSFHMMVGAQVVASNASVDGLLTTLFDDPGDEAMKDLSDEELILLRALRKSDILDDETVRWPLKRHAALESLVDRKLAKYEQGSFWITRSGRDLLGVLDDTGEAK